MARLAPRSFQSGLAWAEQLANLDFGPLPYAALRAGYYG